MPLSEVIKCLIPYIQLAILVEVDVMSGKKIMLLGIALILLGIAYRVIGVDNGFQAFLRDYVHWIGIVITAVGFFIPDDN